MPLISVVLPTFNRSKLLLEAIDSVLKQQNADFELVISDNCSTDNTQEAVQPYLADPRVKYFRNSENIGMVGNWRCAIFERTNADWFLIMSDDDHFVDDDYLSKASALIRQHPSIKFLYAGGYILNEENGKKRVLKPPFSGVTNGIDVFLSRGTVKPQDITLCNMIFRKQDAIDMGFLHNEDNLSCDSEHYLKLCLLGDAGVIPEPVSLYRFHEGNLVKKTLTSARYIRGNLDYLVEPYVFAKPRITAGQLKTFRENVDFDDFIKRSLIRLAAYRRESYEEALALLNAKLPSEMLEIYNDWFFKAKVRFTLANPDLVNARMKIGD